MPPEVMETAVESPEISSGAGETTETGAEVTESTEGNEGISNQGDSQQENQGLTAKPGAKGKLSLADVAKTKIEALKAIDPALPGTLRAAAYELNGFQREFPGGLKEATALKNGISEFGGLEGVKQTAQDYAEVGAVTRSFFDGKPEFWDSLIGESPEAFSRMMPSGLERWKQHDPASYDHAQSKVLTQTLDGIKAQDTIAAVWESLDAEKQKPARETLAAIWQALDGIRKKGEQAPERKTDPNEERLRTREQELETREQSILMKPVSAAGRAQLGEIVEREMGQAYKWAEADPDVQAALRDKVESELVKILKADKGYQAERDRLKERGDYEGLTRHIKNVQARLIPTIIPRVAKLFAVKPKGTPASTIRTAAATNGANGGNGTQNQNWERVSAMPKFADIDRAAMGRDYEDLILSNKAILKDKRRVTWP